jgi:hypothetical protein
MSNQNPQDAHQEKSQEFDIFANPEEDDLQVHLAKGSYQWTNKYTKILGVLVIAVALLSAGAWYGHHTATASANTSVANSFASLRSTFGGGASGGAASGFSGFGGFSRGSSGTVTQVSGTKVTVDLGDKTVAAGFKAGDSIRLNNRSAAGGFTAAPQQSQSSTGTHTQSAPANKTSAQPSVAPSQGTSGGFGSGSGSGRSGGRFANPAFQKCLADNGVTITPGQRPDRSDPKVAAALSKCFSQLGFPAPGSGGGGQAPQPAPSN